MPVFYVYQTAVEMRASARGREERQGRQGRREGEGNPGDASGRNRDAGTDVYSRHVNHKARSSRVRPVNSRVPCYFEYKNFRGIALARGRRSERVSGRAGE